jgi:hypothetical protein
MAKAVIVPGCEWPGSEWDVTDAWYRGTIVREDKTGMVHVTFEGETEEIEFTRESLKKYRDMYETYKFDVLVDTCAVFEIM